ncbi:MAG: DUF3656 domain-containing protein [Velocimicrobium sp.]
MRKIEILAPAGSYEGMKAAINASCDAIYIGGNKFGARAFANNLDEEDMKRAIDYSHLHGKKIYLTVNTLLKENEIKDMLYDYVKPYYEVGLDAIIVQDVGVAKFVQENFPNMDIHASTQMTLTMAEGANQLKEYGITRFVPARELTLQEISEVRGRTDLEMECFVHGALCYCYSGQCLLSSMIGGRSGNRGRCAQPCRMLYEMGSTGRSGYFLSPKDICTLDLIPDMIEAGIDSFKIEGRMKRPEYAALCSFLYGKYTDIFLEQGREGFQRFLKDHITEFKKDKMALADLYNRGGFSAGYYNTYHGKTMMSMKRPNHNGVLVGSVQLVTEGVATIKLSEDINSQDVLEFRDKREQAMYDYTVGASSYSKDIITANFKYNSKIEKENLVYRTKNQKLLDFLNHEFLAKDKKIGIEGRFACETGKPFRIMLSFAQKSIKVEGDLIQAAQNHPVTEEKIKEAIGKISDTNYYFKSLTGNVSLDAFMPMGAIKNLRRLALDTLEKAILEDYRRPLLYTDQIMENEKKHLLKKECLEKKDIPEVHVLVHSNEQFDVAINTSEVKRIYAVPEHMSKEEWMECIRKARRYKKEIFASLPYVFRSKSFDTYASYNMVDVDGYLIHTFEEIAFLNQYETSKEWVLDSNMYTFNSYAKQFWMDKGIHSFTIPIEWNEREIKQRERAKDTLIVYGHIPLMISAQCLQENCLSCKQTPGFSKLMDRKEKQYYVYNFCKYCYNIMYDGEAISLIDEIRSINKLGPDSIRLDFTMESKMETQVILKHFIDAVCYNKSSKAISNTSKGHYRRGIE